MADILTTEERSRRMSLVRGFGNASTELRLMKLLKNTRITGWRRHVTLPGCPDFSFRAAKLAVFVDGDFWHGNPVLRPPSSNKEFWAIKIAANRARDRQADAALKAKGWAVLRIWESDLKKTPDAVIRKIKRQLSSRKITAKSSKKSPGPCRQIIRR